MDRQVVRASEISSCIVYLQFRVHRLTLVQAVAPPTVEARTGMEAATSSDGSEDHSICFGYLWITPSVSPGDGGYFGDN